MDYKWQILQCNSCKRIHAEPVINFKEIYNDCLSKFICPYCGSQELIYKAKRDKMNANRGVDNMSEETIKNDINGYQE